MGKTASRMHGFVLAAILTALVAVQLAVPRHALAEGTLVSAPSRVDTVYDDKRGILYITNGSQVLRYSLQSGSFLAPFSLGGSLSGIDISPDENSLVVADQAYGGGQCWVHLVDLTTGTDQKVTFSQGFGEGGTWTAAFAADGSFLVSSRYLGSGWVPLRRYDPATHATTTLRSVRQDTMLSASADASVVAYAESNISSGPWGVFKTSTGVASHAVDIGWFLYEIGVSRRGDQYSVPTYNGTYVYDGSYSQIGKIGAYAGAQPIGVVYSPTRDIVYYAFANTTKVRAYDTATLQQVDEFDAGMTFDHPGNWAFTSGRLKMSRDGRLLFVTVSGGVRIIDVSGSSVAGHVRDASTGEPLDGVQVRLYDATKAWAGDLSTVAASATTAPDGSYSIWGLPPGEYVVGFCDLTGRYRDVAYGAGGLPLKFGAKIQPGYTASNVDARLMPLSILATMRPARVAGLDRYETALAISQTDFESADAAVLVTGESFPDALAAAPLAGSEQAPMLLTRRDSLPDGVIAELKRLGVKRLYAVGGTGVISDRVSEALVATGLPRPTRIGGTTRYETAARITHIVRELNAQRGVYLPPFICRGDTFPDALSVSPFAYAERRPILLADASGLPAPTVLEWGRMSGEVSSTVIAVGGTGAITYHHLDLLAGECGDGLLHYGRLAGDTRYDTCRAIINAYRGPFDTLGVAAGETFPDALAGGAALGHLGGPIVLTPSTALHAAARTTLQQNGPYVLLAEVFGGSSAVSAVTGDGVRSALGSRVYDIDAAGGRVQLSGAGSQQGPLRAKRAASALRLGAVDWQTHSLR